MPTRTRPPKVIINHRGWVRMGNLFSQVASSSSSSSFYGNPNFVDRQRSNVKLWIGWKRKAKSENNAVNLLFLYWFGHFECMWGWIQVVVGLCGVFVNFFFQFSFWACSCLIILMCLRLWLDSCWERERERETKVPTWMLFIRFIVLYRVSVSCQLVLRVGLCAQASLVFGISYIIDFKHLRADVMFVFALLFQKLPGSSWMTSRSPTVGGDTRPDLRQIKAVSVECLGLLQSDGVHVSVHEKWEL